MNTNFAFSLENAFNAMSVEFMSVVPQLLGALIVVIVGFILGGILKRVIAEVFKKLSVDSALDAAGLDVLTEKAGYTLNSGAFVGTIAKWFVVIVFFVAALDILNLQQATVFLRDFVLGYIPQVIVAVLIMLGGIILSNFVAHAVIAAGKATSFASADFLGKFAQYAVLTFAVLAALNQLQIAPELVQLMFAGLVFALALAFGLAFGLGGRDAAAHTLKHMMGGKHDHSRE